MNMDISLSIALVGIAISVATFFIGRQTSAKSIGHSDGRLRADVDYIKRRTDEVLLEQRSINKDVTELAKKVIEIESSVKQAHKRLDELMGSRKGE